MLVDLALLHDKLVQLTDRTTLNKIFSCLTERLAEQYLDYVKSLELGANGAFQLEIELEFVKKSLYSLLSERTRRIFSLIQDYLDDIATYNQIMTDSYGRLKQNIIEDIVKKTSQQLACFNAEN